MADPKGFLKYSRTTPTRRPAELRIHDWKEVYNPFPEESLVTQAARCMDCGIPFCHRGCPLGNLIPEWNDFAYRSNWREAIDRLHATNNFPEFTGRLCPAPCETACVLGITADPVAIKTVEQYLADKAFDEGWITAVHPRIKTGKKVAVAGSGPAGLAAAQQLSRAGHEVTVYERADRIGGLLRYGIPEFKMEKAVLERRLDQMRAEGTVFITGAEIGKNIDSQKVLDAHDAVVLTVGSTMARDLPAPGRELKGIYQALEYLPISNRVQEGDFATPSISAEGKKVVIIGGGDTGADCLGTAHRQGAETVTQLEILPKPPESRDPTTPWPTWPLIYRVSSAHEEGGIREFSINTERFVGNADGTLRAILVHKVETVVEDGRPTFKKVEGSDFEIECDMVFLAMGFVGPERDGILSQLNIETDARGNIATDANWVTSNPKVFAAGDARRGQSLIVWAIAEGRSVANAVDCYLMGSSDLPSPLTINDRPIAVF
ncbi:MAG: glutamate synthase subunit beta [Acidimicrobiaceae bacterium]|nr:glutamate synthase subunit beta [Acidimicrobiaceae bacterium]